MREKEAEEHRKKIASEFEHYEQPLAERVEKALTAWVGLMEKMQKRKLRAEEIDKKREWYRDVEIKSETFFREEHGEKIAAEGGR